MAEEGGLPGVLWAGERVRYGRKKPPVRVVIGFESDDYGHELQAGLPALGKPPATLFTHDPEIKEEAIWVAGTRRRPLMLD